MDRTHVPPFTIAVRKVGAVAVCTLAGELDQMTASVLLDTVSGLDCGTLTTVVFDCQKLTFVDARGLTALLRAQAAVNEADTDLVLVRPSAVLVRILHVTDLADTFPVADASWLDALGSQQHAAPVAMNRPADPLATAASRRSAESPQRRRAT